MTQVEYLLKECDPVIRKFAKSFRIPDHDEDDLYQEGIIIALKAAKNFKKEQGVLFTTYVHPYLERHFINLIDRENRRKRSTGQNRKDGLREMEKTKPIFPSRFQVGLIYRLEPIISNGDEGSGFLLNAWSEEYPIVVENELCSQSMECAIEVNDLVTQISKALEGVERVVFNAIVFPPPALIDQIDTEINGVEYKRKNGEKVRKANGKIASGIYARFLGINLYTFNKSVKSIRKIYFRILKENR